MKRSQIVYRTKRTSLRKKSKFKQKFFGGLFFCLVIGLGYFLIFSPILWIENIEIKDSPLTQVKGLSLIAKILEEKIFHYLPQKSIVLAPLGKIQAHLLETFPEIKSIDIQKKWPRTLVIKLEKRNPIGIWCGCYQTQPEPEDQEPEEICDDCFYIDDEGVIYQGAPMMEGGLVLTIEETREKTVHLKEKVVSLDCLNFILATKKQLGEELNLLATKFKINSIHDLVVTTSEGWQIYFDPSASAQNQIRVLARVLEEEIKEDRAGLEYIDLRMENRAYYK